MANIVRVVQYQGNWNHLISTQDIPFYTYKRHACGPLQVWTSDSALPAFTFAPDPQVGDLYRIFILNDGGDTIDRWEMGPAHQETSGLEGLAAELAKVEQEQRNCESAMATTRVQLEDAKAALGELNNAVHSGYDFNSDPQRLTLRVGKALSEIHEPAIAPRVISLAEGGRAIVSSFSGIGGGTRYLLTFTEPSSLMMADCHAIAAALLAVSDPSPASV